MKKGGTKRIVALLLALAMVFGLNTAAFARSITIDGRQYEEEELTYHMRLEDSNGNLLNDATRNQLVWSDPIDQSGWLGSGVLDLVWNDADIGVPWLGENNLMYESEKTETCYLWVPADGSEISYMMTAEWGDDLGRDAVDVLIEPSPIIKISKGHPQTIDITFRLKGDSSYNSNAGSWVQSGSRWWYQNSDGSYPHAAWEWIDEDWYYFDASGWMQTGWINLGGTWYYLNGDGAMATGWINDGGAWYYMDSNGAMLTGWQLVVTSRNGYERDYAWYYMTGSGAMATGWINDGGTWYYLNGDGAMATGWVSDGGTWYYLNGDGAMATGWVNDGGTWYYLAGSGAMATGWIDLGGTWYYLTGSGAMAADTWIGSYYVNADGAWVA